jgi:hypothetical protein
VLLRDSAGAAHFGCRRWMRGKRGNEGCHAGGGGSGRGGKRRGNNFDGEGADSILRQRRGEAGEGVAMGTTWWREGLGPTSRRWVASTSPAAVRSGRRRAGSLSRQGRAGSLTGGTHATVQGGTAESRPLMHGCRSTVRVVVELDSKKKFQIRLKSNGSNGFKF